MAKRYVCQTRKNAEGDITWLCNHGEHWSPRSITDVIAEIESNAHEYWVTWTNSAETKIRVVQGVARKWLRTDRDNAMRNNLDELPDC